MSSISVTYPATPKHVDEAILQPSSTFKQEVFKVLGAIVFFIIVYIALVAAALVVAIISAWGGLALIVLKPTFITLMIGLGLVGLGVMVVFFLFKFLLKRNKIDRSHLIEITESDQPELFTFIRTLTRETQTPFPKKIYVSAEVNASVFYNSSFWSMFLPVRKNLLIGLGLVNSVNISEFKAILAHEFGHFSQRSMKLGSYVYNVNQIIYNLLYDNDGYARTLESWANVSGYFAFFANITLKIVVGIQWVLQKVYAIVNKNYMSLSRQMEFHADTVAAYVSGGDHLISSLRKLEVADLTYNNLFECYNAWQKEALKPDNLYPQHKEIMTQYAIHHGIPLQHGLPQVDANSFSKFNKARIVIKDQWASHPSTDDREAHLRSLNITTETIPSPAWTIFKNAEELQKKVTDKIFHNATFATPAQTLDVTAFRQRFQAKMDKNKLDNRYKGYFDFRNISSVDLRNIEQKAVGDATSLADILTDTALALPYQIEGLKSDINTLEAIQNGSAPIDRFEFDGKKYKRADVESLLAQLKAELEQTETQLVQTDERVITFFLKQAGKHGQEEQLRKAYSELFITSAAADEDVKNYVAVMQDIIPIYNGTLEFSQIHQIMEKVKLGEVLIKERLTTLLKDANAERYITELDKKLLGEYLAKDHIYFYEPNYNQESLAIFNDSMNIFYNVVTELAFNAKREVLEMQLKMAG